MQLFEIVVSLATLALLVATTVGGRLARHAVRILCVACVAAVLHLVLETIRWQMIPTYVLLLSLALATLKRSRGPLLARLAGLTLGAGLLATSLFLGSQLPIFELPAPDGPHTVGTTRYSVIDSSRPETRTPDPNDQRELFVEVWYPATIPQAGLPRPRTLWPELYRGEMDRVSFFMAYLKGVDTHAYPALPVDGAGGPYPVVIFNHGLQMFTSQNTLLMEHLASHGFVVVSIGHPHDSIRVNLDRAGTVLPDFIMGMDEFREAMAWIERSSRPVRSALDAIEQVESREERAAIMLAAIESSEVNETVSLWVEDTRFVLDHLASPDGSSLPFGAALDLSRLGVVGMSVGGAAAAEFCKSDPRCTTGINIDGLQYGERHAVPLQVPFLMLYSDDGAGANDMLMLSATHDYHEYHLVGARHPDLTDLTVAWPIMRRAGQTGSIPGRRASDTVNRVVLGFLGHYLKGEPFDLDPESVPELTMNVWPAWDDPLRPRRRETGEPQ